LKKNSCYQSVVCYAAVAIHKRIPQKDPVLNLVLGYEAGADPGCPDTCPFD